MSIYEVTVKDRFNHEIDLEAYRNKVLLIVNTASKCGFTEQFAGLEKLYQKYQEQGLAIIGFPCDQFKNQEFGDINETIEFCQMNYGVTFPIMAKVDVNGDNEDQLFTYLKSAKHGLITDDIKWNFTKFLVDRQGTVVKRYAPQTTPESFEKEIVKLLNN